VGWATWRQNLSRASRAPSGPPTVSPSASTAAFIAPELVALTPSTIIRRSSSRRSRTPQVNAPCAPPPCSARLICFTGISKSQGRERVVAADGHDDLRSVRYVSHGKALRARVNRRASRVTPGGRAVHVVSGLSNRLPRTRQCLSHWGADRERNDSSGVPVQAKL
jgi:hypothetical protein